MKNDFFYKEHDVNYCFSETRNSRDYTKYYEGLFAQGSGYLQMRASFEEGLLCANEGQSEEYFRMPANVTVEKPRHPFSKWGVYVPGITGLHPLLNEEIVNLPYILALSFYVNGTKVDMESPSISGYERMLDVRDGVLYRSFEWTDDRGTLSFNIKRFVSRDLRNVIINEIDIKCLEGSGSVEIVNDIDTEVCTNGYNHFKNIDKQIVDGFINVNIETDNDESVYMLSGLFENENVLSSKRYMLEKSDSLQLVKISSITTSRDTGFAPYSLAQEKTLLEHCSKNLDSIYFDHEKTWSSMWKNSKMIIMGDERAQRTVNFSIYHMLRAINDKDNRVAICAKGFSGEAYFGHFFWDSEIYLLPFFIYTQPDMARKLIEFRIGTLKGALENAKAYGYDGARYPWESSVSGKEQCPNWQYADNEVHITADVVLGLVHYYAATGDKSILSEGLEMLLETAKYWTDRVHLDSAGQTNINGVMGPDEYICFSNNNRYTNYLVSKSLEWTKKIVEFLGDEGQSGLDKAGLDDNFLTVILELSKGLAKHVNFEGVIPQCDHFSDFEDIDFDDVWKDKSKPFGSIISQEHNYRVKALKQADVLMLPYLFKEDFSIEQLKENYDYYFPITTHDSSLSVIVHSVLKSRLGDREEAYDLFTRALDIDFDEKKSGASEGIHIANCGGIWQGIILGFAGMSIASDGEKGIALSPVLPSHWQKLSFNICVKNIWHSVTITQNGYTIENI